MTKAIEPITMQSVAAFIFEFERNHDDSAPTVREIVAHFGIRDMTRVIREAREAVAAGLLWQDPRQQNRYRTVKRD